MRDLDVQQRLASTADWECGKAVCRPDRINPRLRALFARVLQHSSPCCFANGVTLAGQTVLARTDNATVAPGNGAVALVQGQHLGISRP